MNRFIKTKDDPLENCVEKINRIENKIFAKEMEILDFLIKNFPQEEFSLKDIKRRENFVIKIGKKSLKSLTKKELLYQDPISKKYSLNTASSRIAKIIMEYEEPLELNHKYTKNINELRFDTVGKTIKEDNFEQSYDEENPIGFF